MSGDSNQNDLSSLIKQGYAAPLPESGYVESLREKLYRELESLDHQPAASLLQAAPRRRRMFYFPLRGLVAAAAAVLLAAAGLWMAVGPSDSNNSLAAAMRKTLSADSLQLKITCDGQTGEAWLRPGRQLRWNWPNGTYQIAREGRIWTVDEKANRAASQASSLFQEKQPGAELFGLMSIPPEKEMLEAGPAEQVQRDGRKYDLYRWEKPSTEGTLRIEAAVEAQSGLLQSLEAMREKNGRREPIGRVDVIARNKPVAEELFVVGDTLTEDGRIGKVTDVQGVVALRPATSDRWTPLAERMLLRLGDWLRTDLRGANALSLRLVRESDVVLGPGTLVELVSPRQIRIADGELRVTASKKAPVEIAGPDGQKITVEGKQLYRVQAGKLARIEKDPQWLLSYEGKSTNQSIGSLVAKVDGRNVPLTVGYHKVTVDIRDQIARTTIEESFVNHTNGTLEGVFHFPLPQDASIAGFGMWIGNELVEADVVEKQRAREIYEEIKRERRDPGLLEWTGGNIFSARVFPIVPHSEKRIKITYTQVLPLKGNAYRYQYALQSELLKQHPLRQLEIDVKVNSAIPLKAISSPTHLTRNAQTAHSGHVEFSAQQYTPTQDFEVVVEVGGRQESVVMIPHRRGNDGYFMVQLTPPAPSGDQPSAGAWQRELLPTGEPLELVILADTSASMDAASRVTQAELVAALLGSLTAKDKFNLATCDVDCRWAFDRVREADRKTVAAAREFLAGRTSLGWTDLDKAFAAVLPRCGANTRVVYIGDGIVTACGAGVPPAQGSRDGCTTADPVAFAQRLRRTAEGKPGTFHAVAVSSSFEPGVMKAIAALGGGSVRQVSGSNRPAAVARDLLAEMTQPAVRDLKVEFRGLRTARVYPADLPNLPQGTQQILLGRYLPEGRDQTGEIIVTGTQAGKPVKFAAMVSLKDAEQGNSFIPRLWARMHLDALLEQGATSVIRDEIIALSEEYNIITPYTSFLVLETDADRERFKVKRRFQMRDGQKFFAQGIENANWELVQQQMKRAGTWRIGLRRDVLRQLAALGRYPLFPMNQRGGSVGLEFYARNSAGSGQSSALSKITGTGGGGGSFIGGMSGLGLDFGQKFNKDLDWYESAAPSGGPVGVEEQRRLLVSGGDAMSDGGEVLEEAIKELEKAEKSKISSRLSRLSDLQEDFDLFADARKAPESTFAMEAAMASPVSAPAMPASAGTPRGFAAAGDRISGHFFGYVHAIPMQPYGEAWLSTLFPWNPAPPKEREWKTKTPWPADARAVAQKLLRNEQIVGVKDGLRIEIQSQSFDARWNELSSHSHTFALASPAGWLSETEGDNSQTTIAWCDDQERGVLSRAFLLGRVRKATAADRARPPLDLGAGTMTSLERNYAGYKVELKPQGEQRTLLVLTTPGTPPSETQVLVDAARGVVLRVESRHGGKIASTQTFGDFVEVAGAWWTGRVETTDAEGRRVSLVTQKITALKPGELDRQWKDRLAARQQVQLLREPLPRLVEAKRALAAGKASFEDHVLLMLHFQATQQWDRVLEHLVTAEQLAAGKPGMRWVRTMVLNQARRREEVKKRYMEEGSGIRDEGLASDQYFLANHILNQSGGILEANEMLALFDVLRPVFARQPPRLLAVKNWNQRRVQYLDQAGQSQDAMQLRKQLAEEYPRDANLQQQYARSLVNKGEYDPAYAWLDRVLASEIRWLPYEEEGLRSTYAEFLRSQGRYDELAKYLAAWVQRNPPGESAYQQYLSALVWTDRLDEANRLIHQWLKDAQRSDALPPEVAARLQAAVAQALGQGYNLSTNRLDDRWLTPLADAAIFFARHPTQAHTADRIMNQWQFQQTDECRRVRRTALKVLRQEMDKLDWQQIARLVRWIESNDPAVEQQDWKQIAAALQPRWADALNSEIKHQLGQTLSGVWRHVGAAEQLAFLRRQLEQGPEQYRANYANELFNALLAQPWSVEYESEALGLLERLSDAEEPDVRLAAQVTALYRLTDRMVQARFDARMAKVEHQEKLTRTELRDKKEENLRLARQELSDRLRQETAKHGTVLAPWFQVERLYLEVLVGRDLDKVAAECFELLGRPRATATDDTSDDLGRRLDEALRYRCLATLLNLAARKEAKPALGDRVLAYLEESAAAAPEESRYQILHYQLLIALDRPKDLQKKLQEWIGKDDADNFWRRSLGYLLAEQGKIRDAIELFEKVRSSDELSAAEHRTLADWYLVADRRESHDRALIEAYKTTDEWRLRNWIQQKLQPWQRTDQPPPRELDREVLLALTALFEKSSAPQNHLYLVQQFYQATHDFRLLAGLADAVIGHTPGQVYPFLQNMGGVLSEVRDEATADSLVEQIAKIRPRAKAPMNERALDLLEMLVERRGAELLNQPGPHAARAMDALERAWKRQWSAGEPRLMADLLASLGHIAHPELALLQIRKLEILHRESAAGSADRLHIAHALARAYWGYPEQEKAIDLLVAALDERQAASGGVLPVTANDPLTTLISYLEQKRHFARGEKVLFEQLKHPANPQQVRWLTQRLCQLYRNALEADGEVSLGTGRTLYQAVQVKIFEELKSPDDYHRHNLVSCLCDIYRTAHRKRLPGVIEDFRAFAFQRLPEMLKRQTNHYESLVSTVAHALHAVVGPRDGLAFLIGRIEVEPVWLRYNGQDGWSRYAYQLGQWRQEVKDLGDLEERLLRIVLAELRQDLQTRQSRNRTIYWRHHSHFWMEKADAFARTAEEVLAKNRQSGTAVAYLADYFYNGLERYGRAIEILQDAHRRELLDESAQSRLVEYLQQQDRYGESIPVLEPLVQRRPDTLEHRVRLMRAYFRTGRQADLMTLLQKTDAHFHQQNRWQENAMAALGASCLENELYQQSVDYYKEAISLHQRTAPRRGIGDGTLSEYYRKQAMAYSGLKKTAEAVDAACGAIVSWGPTHRNRAEAIRSLQDVLRTAPDLDAFAAALDREAEKTREEKPIVRKALGQVYLKKQQFARAITQLNVALELQPNDAQTHQALLDCYEKQGDKQGVIEQLLRWRELSRRDIKLYEDLGKRLDHLGRADEAERAYTSIVEALPSESESHTLLAEVRQRQNRWDDAIVQWEQAARIRSLEPTGLLKLAEAQLHQQRWDDASATLRKLTLKTWPPRFGDVQHQVDSLQRKIPPDGK